GVFRSDIPARNVYLLIAATGYFYISNRHTLSAFLGEDLQAPQAVADWQAFIISTVLRTVMLNP
ncbi:MAG: transcriptional regulator, TetR family, partial [Polaromonas sp.]|nr:transcriptional regulator, TetR family [Polaromonas sp.]